MSSLVRWIVLSLLALSTGLHAQVDKKVREIVIRSYWGDLGTRPELTVTILGSPDGFQRDGKTHNGLAEVQTKDGSVGYIDRSGKYVWGPSKRNDPTE